MMIQDKPESLTPFRWTCEGIIALMEFQLLTASRVWTSAFWAGLISSDLQVASTCMYTYTLLQCICHMIMICMAANLWFTSRQTGRHSVRQTGRHYDNVHVVVNPYKDSRGWIGCNLMHAFHAYLVQISFEFKAWSRSHETSSSISSLVEQVKCSNIRKVI